MSSEVAVLVVLGLTLLLGYVAFRVLVDKNRAANDVLRGELENLAKKNLEDQRESLTRETARQIGSLLAPFREQLESFRKRVDEVHTEDTVQSARLREQVRQLQELSNKVSDEANNLATAIKGDAKKQGNWGEVIVERVFAASGLERGRDYDVQLALTDEDGAVKIPDFVVHLPEEKVMVVDAKVSLTAFERFCSAGDEVEREKARAEHVLSVRRHVRELCAKDYGHLLGNRTLDFVIMCIPLEPAYQAALQHDPDLMYSLAGEKVVITGPTTLMLTLKVVAQIWRREHENRNAEVIAEKAGKIYDQVVLVVEAMVEARRRLGGASEAMDLALKRLAEGRGNLVGRVEEMRRLGAHVKRRLPAGVVEQSGAEDGDEDGEEQAEDGPAAGMVKASPGGR